MEPWFSFIILRQELLFQKALNENKHYFDEFKEVNLKFTDFIMYKKNEIKDMPYINIKNEENISKFSNKRKNEMSFSTIKNVILDIKNSNECPNNYLNSENSININLH